MQCDHGNTIAADAHVSRVIGDWIPHRISVVSIRLVLQQQLDDSIRAICLLVDGRQQWGEFSLQLWSDAGLQRLPLCSAH